MVSPDAGQCFVRDTELRGFGVRITATGRKSFILEKRVNGRVRRMTLGREGELTVAQARNRAQQLLGQIALGDDPVQKRRREQARQISLSDVYDEFLKVRSQLSDSTLDDYNRAIHKIFKDWKAKPIQSISSDMIMHRHRRIARERGELSANRYMRVLRAIFNFAIDRYDDGSGEAVLAANPVMVLTRTRAWYHTERRQTVIKPHQLKDWLAGVESLRENDYAQQLGDAFADFFLLVLFTGLRRREAATLKWSDVDLAGRTLTVSKTKSRRPHSLPFSDYISRPV